MQIRKHISVFDYDDVLHDYNTRVCESIGINKTRIITFNPKINPLLSESEKKQLIEAYSDPSFFQDVTYYDGIERFTELQANNISCYINSHCYTEEIKQLKLKSIREHIDIPEDHILITVIDKDYTNKKILMPNTTFFIDDRIDNILTSTAQFNIVPNQPWNTSHLEARKLTGRPIIRKKNLSEVMNCLLAFVE